MEFRKAKEEDITAVEGIYDRILKKEESGEVTIGWERGVYPTRRTAEEALAKDILFVCEDDGKVVAAAKIDQTQVPEYADCTWQYPAADDEVMVLHTLVVDPECPHRGYGREFVSFYEKYSLENGCHYLRIDTNEKNTIARGMYRKLGYIERGVVPCVFNGIPGVQLVCLEKKI